MKGRLLSLKTGDDTPRNVPERRRVMLEAIPCAGNLTRRRRKGKRHPPRHADAKALRGNAATVTCNGMYNKLFTKILDSSIWLESGPTRLVWLTFLAAMDEDGYVQFAAPANVAHRARVTVEEAEEALRVLESPDKNSSNPTYDGRRVERVPGGWIVLNAKEHRELVTRVVQREQTNERVRRFRERKRSGNARVTPSEAEAEAESEKKKTDTSASAHMRRSMQGASGQRAQGAPAAPRGRSGNGKPIRLSPSDLPIFEQQP